MIGPCSPGNDWTPAWPWEAVNNSLFYFIYAHGSSFPVELPWSQPRSFLAFILKKKKTKKSHNNLTYFSKDVESSGTSEQRGRGTTEIWNSAFGNDWKHKMKHNKRRVILPQSKCLRADWIKSALFLKSLQAEELNRQKLWRNSPLAHDWVCQSVQASPTERAYNLGF